MKTEARRKRAPKAARRSAGAKRRTTRRTKRGRSGSWPTALTEAEAARRHLAQAATAVERLLPELTALRESAAAVAREELARQLLAGPDGGALGLLQGLAATDRLAAIVLERLTAAVRLEAVQQPGARVVVTEASRTEYESLDGHRPAGSQECLVVRSGWRQGERLLTRPVVARPQPCP